MYHIELILRTKPKASEETLVFPVPERYVDFLQNNLAIIGDYIKSLIQLNNESEKPIAVLDSAIEKERNFFWLLRDELIAVTESQGSHQREGFMCDPHQNGSQSYFPVESRELIQEFIDWCEMYHFALVRLFD